MKYKTIAVNKGMKKMISEVADEGESVDKTLSRLLDELESNEVQELDSSRANIHVSEETFHRLNDAKLFSTEAYISVIFRLINSKKLSTE